MTEKRTSLKQSIDAVCAGLSGTVAASRRADATDAFMEGMDGFSEMMNRVQDKLPHLRRGHLFEPIIAAKENAKHAAAGAGHRMGVTHLEGNHTAPADLILRGGAQITEGQAKFSVQSPFKIAEIISDQKYLGMDRYVPADKVEQVRAVLLEKARTATFTQQATLYSDAAHHLQVHDTGTIEVWIADRHPTLYRLGSELGYVAKEAATAGAYGAMAGVVLGWAISGVRNAIASHNGDKSNNQALTDNLKNAGRSSLRSGATAAGGAVIRYGATKAGANALARSNVATAVAAGLIDAGMAVYDYTMGHVSAEQAAERLRHTGVSTVGGIYGGAVTSSVIGGPVVVAALGSMAGYMLASFVYQTSAEMLQRARLAEARARRVEALCAKAIHTMREQRTEFEQAFERRLHERETAYRSIFAALDAGLGRGAVVQTTEALGNLTRMVGKDLGLRSFQEFDLFMRTENAVLRI